MIAPGPRHDLISSTSIIRAGLVEETYSALRDWDLDASKVDNIKRLNASATVAAVSGSWRKDILQAISRRLDPGGRDRSLTMLAQCGLTLESWRPLLLWHITRDEYLLRSFLVDWFFEARASGKSSVTADDVEGFLRSKDVAKRLKAPWQSVTVRRLANALLQNALDFGLAVGLARKEFTSYHLPEESFVYLLHAMADAEPNARRIVDSNDWRMFLMDAGDVERELLRLHQYRKVHYEVAGSLAQLKLPHRSSADYAQELCA
jgi:fermentation-respiration switch protein FrsA (DUF1100 family)